ncbi:DNA translocase FtsK [Qingshengfaniella alkalisoli]|uniref:DNA translocase FtsK n=1 Tax=Qingshengfaniella alkalisoli TaxID=2599296 RepID=A0A5B8I539_9RHOB|nr:DNA translocase FtsK [Qingshengfaniella alkalisoli]QDY68355.1 DNA translocase FtsK [Qingshengfaniella alkalisoli]
MAYQTKTRDPLFDTATQATLERRARELVGLGLLAVAVVLAVILGSYAPSDPSFLGTSNEPPQNVLGHFGAYVASPLFVILGYGSWYLPVVAAAWGIRFLLHQGQDRAVTRLIFMPLAAALSAIYAATHLPSAGWTHSFGLGGLFGDTMLGVLLGILPLGSALSLKLSAVLLAVGLLALGGYTLGFTKPELQRIGHFLWFGILMAFDQFIRLLGRAGSRAADGVSNTGSRISELRASRDAVVEDDEMFEEEAERRPSPVIRAQRAPEPVVDEPEEPIRTLPGLGLFNAVTGRKQAAQEDEFELVDDDDDEFVDDNQEERVRGKISDAIRYRMRQDRAKLAAATRQRQEPPITAAQGHADTVEAEDEPIPAPPRVEARKETLAAETTPTSQPAAPIPRYQEPRPVVQHNVKRSAPSTAAKAEAQPDLQFEQKVAEYEHPPLSLLSDPSSVEKMYLSDEALEENARMLENVLDDYGVKGDIVSVRPGPVVTMYELEPAPGLKASRVIGLADDIARSMSALSARVSTVPGRSVIGIELPNESREMVLLREILAARDFGDSKMRLPLALGKDIGGESVVANLAKMPHLLIAGTTGSGKSVAINTMILSLLYKLTPEECRLIMIDPKMLELSVYDGIPHLLSPVVTDPKKAVVALKWVVGEMEERYRKMSKMGVRNIEGYNGKVRDALSKGEMFSRTVQTGFDDETGDPVFETEESVPEALPYIVVIVDEMADLMMVAGKEIEACIQRLAQMARASGIHLIMATQRPSVDVITGTIKANFPTRISFQVTSKVDSRTILGEQGAEQLLGQGDMLYMAGGAKITRVHGPFVSDEEVEEVVNHLKSFGAPEYIGGVVDGPDEQKADDIDMVLGLGGNTTGEDALYDQAVQIVIQDRKCSTSYIQRKLAIGYNKAARLVEQMEENGLVSAANHVGKREILVPEQQ